MNAQASWNFLRDGNGLSEVRVDVSCEGLSLVFLFAVAACDMGFSPKQNLSGKRSNESEGWKEIEESKEKRGKWEQKKINSTEDTAVCW